jgi:acyl-CoA synthetase (AMP-forming)/AMP-acid ligase II
VTDDLNLGEFEEGEETTVPALLAAMRGAERDRELLVMDRQRLTYRQADARSARLARQLTADGVGLGTRVGLLLPNGPEFVISWLAVTRIGAVAVPISTLSTASELRRICVHSSLHQLVTTPAYLHHNYVERLESSIEGLAEERSPYALVAVPYLRKVWMWGEAIPKWSQPIDLSEEPPVDGRLLSAMEAQVAPSDAVSIIYTSGSAADPKGVVHTHGTFMRSAMKARWAYNYCLGDRLFTQMPFFWVGGLTVSLLAAALGGATLLSSAEAAPADVLDFIERERVTSVMAWPHLARALASDPSFPGRDLASVRSGSLHEAIPEDRRPRDPTLMNSSLGMTETAGPHTQVSLTELPERLRGSFGPSLPGMEHKIVALGTDEPVRPGDLGELLLRGDQLMLGFVRKERAETFEPEGWYRTRDLCSFREGNIIFHGRIDDLIKASGANVSPREVEGVLRSLPGVLDAVVSGVRDQDRGRVVGAVVVAQPGAMLTAEELQVAARIELSAYKVPRVIVVRGHEDVPMLSSGKIDRRAIIRLLEGAAEAG